MLKYNVSEKHSKNQINKGLQNLSFFWLYLSNKIQEKESTSAKPIISRGKATNMFKLFFSNLVHVNITVNIQDNIS